MTSTMQHELQELRAAAESYDARHVHLEHFAYPPGIRMAVNLTVDFDAMLLRRVHNEPPMQLAKGEFGGRVGIWRLLEALFSHLQDFPGIWNPTATQCAHYWHIHYPASTALHLESSIWQDYPGSLS